MRWAGHVAEWGRRGMHTGYWWESQKEGDHCEEQDIGVDNIKIDLREIVCDSGDWMDMAQDRHL
jgi:hypothetical protein